MSEPRLGNPAAPLLIPGTAAHALDTTPFEPTRATFELADRYNAPFQIHTVEARDEDERIRESIGRGTIEALDSIGALRPARCSRTGRLSPTRTSPASGPAARD